jgi:hypothetical protein
MSDGGLEPRPTNEERIASSPIIQATIEVEEFCRNQAQAMMTEENAKQLSMTEADHIEAVERTSMKIEKIMQAHQKIQGVAQNLEAALTANKQDITDGPNAGEKKASDSLVETTANWLRGALDSYEGPNEIKLIYEKHFGLLLDEILGKREE